MGNHSVVKLSAEQWVSIKQEGIMNVEDLVEFEDDDIDNVILNLRRPQDVWHLTQLAVPGSADILANPNVNPPVVYQAAVARRERVVAWTKKQPPMVCSALLVKKMKLAADIVLYYTGVGRPLTMENMKYVILKDYNDHVQ